ncbi:MAG TPA: glutathione S-transferase N-terminal domain-containing protein [Conexibacter sp.]|nr:glutathione S-transferase N-terminal domain-containing protein [Conexibacter sp.]
MAVKLHRCSIMWIRGPHPCWRVQKALDEAGVEYELVQHPPRRGKRDALEAKSGQRKLPVIELDDGTTIREESKDLAARVRAGALPPRRVPSEAPQAPPPVG